MDKLQFEFSVVASPADPKTNTTLVTSISTENGERFVLPPEMQNITHHAELRKTEIYGKLKDVMKRHDKKKIWIAVTGELKGIYIDEVGNVRFKNYFLDQIDEKQQTSIGEKDELRQLIEQLIVLNKGKSGSKDLKNISEKFILEKFSSKTSNVNQWIEMFEKECNRFEISEDNMMIEILRLFLEKSCVNWYYATVEKLGQKDNWEERKDRFIETFAENGWNAWRYALSYKYKEGLLIDYATKKERLLLEVNNKIDSITLTAIIITGLPEFIADRIDKENITDTTSLFNEIKKHENFIKKKNYAITNNNKSEN